MLIVLYIKRDSIGISKIIDVATKDSQYIPTVYEIYDKSTIDSSNKLIFIQPFNWLILNIENNVYIIDQIGTGLCAVGTTTAYHILKDQISQICLSFDINSMINIYTSTGKKYIVPYEIEGTIFTAISAINELSKFCLQFDPLATYNDSKMKITPMEFKLRFTRQVKPKTFTTKQKKNIAKAVEMHNDNMYKKEKIRHERKRVMKKQFAKTNN